MVKLATPTNKQADILPAGVYIMRLKSIEDAEPSTYKPGQERVLLKYETTDVRDVTIDDGEGDVEADDLLGREQWVWCSNTMGPKSNLRKHVEALLGRPLEEGEPIDDRELIGKQAKVTLDRYVKESGGVGVKVMSIAAHRAAKRITRKAADEDDGAEPF